MRKNNNKSKLLTKKQVIKLIQKDWIKATTDRKKREYLPEDLIFTNDVAEEMYEDE